MKTKKLQKIILSKLFALSLFLLVNCAVTPPDVPVCTEINPTKGFCVKTMSAEEFEVDDNKKWNSKTWWDLRPEMILLPVDSWVQLKSFIIKVCKKSNQCSGPSVSNWERTIEVIDKKISKD